MNKQPQPPQPEPEQVATFRWKNTTWWYVFERIYSEILIINRYIDYPNFVNVVKYKLHKMQEQVCYLWKFKDSVLKLD
jgi:hypothetical protein